MGAHITFKNILEDFLERRQESPWQEIFAFAYYRFHFRFDVDAIIEDV